MTHDPKAVLRARGLVPKKSFGQNFLRDANIVAKIADLAVAGDQAKTTRICEIGAGTGALTAKLAERALAVVAIERDRDLVPVLVERFADAPHVRVVEADAKTADLREHLGATPPRALVGNLPYQLTGVLLENATRLARSFERAVFMMQREVADRIAAPPGSKTYGALTVFVGAQFAVHRAFLVPPHVFFPAPDVESAVVVLRPREDAVLEDDVFRNVVKLAFAQRRKTLRNAWGHLCDPTRLESACAHVGIDLGARAETLSIAQFAALAAALRT